MSQTPEFAPAFVSVVNEVPEDLYEAMRSFVTSHPHWDQYRLMQVALAGFLFQQGSRERAVARHYLDGLFDRGCGPEGSGAEPPQAPAAVRGSERPAGAGEGHAQAATPQAGSMPPATASRAGGAPSARISPPAASQGQRWAPPAPPHHRSR